MVRGWGDWQTLAVAMALTSLVTAALVLVAVELYRSFTADPNPIRNISPQRVLNDNKRVVSGDVLIVEAIKCNDSDEPISIRGETQYRSVDELGAPPIPNFIGVGDRDPGCRTFTFMNELPQLAPGRWRLEGVESSNGYESTWFTETFEVVGE